jgi:hypothetical protein
VSALDVSPIPSSFRYFANRNSAFSRRITQRMSRSVSGRLELPEETVLALGRDRAVGDAVSDTFIDSAFETGQVRQARTQVEQALASGIGTVSEPLPGLHELFAHLDAEPEWLDWDRIERGAKVFRRYGTDAFRYAGLISLAGYRIEMIYKPLALTGAYTGNSAFRRYLETCKFWIEISEPAALRAGGEGRKTAVLVRILHSIIRHTIAPHPGWDAAWLGVPLSQNALMGPISLSFLMTQHTKLIGHLCSDDEALDMMFFWRYVGYLMGIEAPFYPDTIDDWWRLTYVFMLQDVPNDCDDSRQLGQSFVAAFGPSGTDSPAEARRKSAEMAEVLGWARFFLQNSDYRAMELDDAGWRRWVPLTRVPGNLAIEVARRAVPIDGFIDRRRSANRRAWLDSHLADRPAQFAPAERLTR